MSDEKIGFHLSAKDLHGGPFGSPDSFAAVYEKNRITNELVFLDKTELIPSNQNPEWTKHFSYPYSFQVVQEIVVKIFHKNANIPILVDSFDGHGLIEECAFTLGKLVGTSGQRLSVSFQSRPATVLTIQGEIFADMRGDVVLCIAVSRLTNRALIGKSDPYLKFYRMNEGGVWTLVYVTDSIRSNLDPSWTDLRIPYLSLCNGDDVRALRIEILDDNTKLEDKPMGHVLTSYGDWKNGKTQFPVLEPNGESRGATFTISNLAFVDCPNFVDYVAAGSEISLMLGIDFTSSNGPDYLRDSKSLHYMVGDGLNPYQEAITSVVGEVLESYDTDKKYPVFGFGAKIRNAMGKLGPVKHDFSLSETEVHGVDGILQAYENILPKLSFSGPTYFHPILEKVIEIVKASSLVPITDAIADTTTAIASASISNTGTQMSRAVPFKYFILMLITDGAIDDMEKTKERIIAASDLPLSIIIIGVGSTADFTSMKEIDCDGGLLSVNGCTAKRDIVQFVPLDQYAGNAIGLSEAVLAEIPGQFMAYVDLKGIP